MAFTMYRHEKLYRTYRATFKDRDGVVLTDVNLQAGVLAPRRTPSGTTTWVNVTYTAYPDGPDEDGYYGETTVLLAAPDADPADAIVIPTGGGDFYFNVVDTPEIDAEKVERITVA